MKKMLLLLLFTATSAQAYVCTSEEHPQVHLNLLQESGNLYSGKIYVLPSPSKPNQLFVGKKLESELLFYHEFELYNQSGETFLFTLKPIFNPGHCRARVCNDPQAMGKNIGKLTDSKGNDEYFTCF